MIVKSQKKRAIVQGFSVRLIRMNQAVAASGGSLFCQGLIGLPGAEHPIDRESLHED